jgi:hypothetical protein
MEVSLHAVGNYTRIVFEKPANTRQKECTNQATIYLRNTHENQTLTYIIHDLLYTDGLPSRYETWLHNSISMSLLSAKNVEVQNIPLTKYRKRVQTGPTSSGRYLITNQDAKLC